MRRVRAELTAHCAGKPSAVQRALIERAVILSLRVEQLDAKIVAGEALTIHNSNYALAWNNALRRTLAALEVKPAAAGRAALDWRRAGLSRAAARGACKARRAERASQPLAVLADRAINRRLL